MNSVSAYSIYCGLVTILLFGGPCLHGICSLETQPVKTSASACTSQLITRAHHRRGKIIHLQVLELVCRENQITSRFLNVRKSLPRQEGCNKIDVRDATLLSLSTSNYTTSVSANSSQDPNLHRGSKRRSHLPNNTLIKCLV